LYRHAEVMGKSLRDDGRLAMQVRTDPANAERVRARFGLAEQRATPVRRRSKRPEK
jgi:hypothetical protein